MPRRTNRIPKYCLHKATSQARVVLDGQTIYLGRHGTEASRQEYERVIGEWLASRRASRPAASPALELDPELPSTAPPHSILVIEVIAGYLRHVRGYYVKNGRPVKEQANVKLALRPLQRLYGRAPAVRFGPLALKVVRQAMVDAGWSRRYINDQVARIKRMFKWAVENELVPPNTYLGLQAVSGLHKGRSEARETEPVRPVADAHVDPIKPFVARQVWAMVQLQRLTGMRPGEVVNMRGCDLDTTRPLWEYRPAGHKTEHLERERIIPLGPHAQEVIKPFLRTETTAYLFSPADADAERREELHRRRKTNLQPSQARRHMQALHRMEHGLRGRTPRDRYTVDSYRRAIARACEQAFPPPEPLARYPKEKIAAWRNRLTAEQQQALSAWRRAHSWFPHQLRHSAATKIRKELGLEAVQVCLGHARADVSQIYAERNLELAREIARRLG